LNPVVIVTVAVYRVLKSFPNKHTYQ